MDRTLLVTVAKHGGETTLATLLQVLRYQIRVVSLTLTWVFFWSRKGFKGMITAEAMSGSANNMPDNERPEETNEEAHLAETSAAPSKNGEEFFLPTLTTEDSQRMDPRGDPLKAIQNCQKLFQSRRWIPRSCSDVNNSRT